MTAFGGAAALALGLRRMADPRLGRRLLVLSAVVPAAALGGAGCGDSEEATPPSSAQVVQRYDDGLADAIEKAFPSVAHVTVTMTGGGTAAGTGIVVDDGGLILTNHHVIEDAQAISLVVGVENAKVPQGSEIVAGPPAGSTARYTFIRVPGSVVARAPGRDLAIVKAPVDGLTPIDLGTATDLRLGQRVIAIGFAFSLRGGPSVTSGIVSGKNRDVELDDGTVYRHLVQTDAAINAGNSGGPLLDVSGRLVGINSVVASAGSAEDIGFAIEVNQALPLIAQVSE